MVSKTTMNIVIGVMLLCLGSILAFGFLLSLPGGNNQASASAVEENNVSGNTKSVDSSTPSIFNYCTWQPEFTKQIGDYYKAPTGKKYAVVTLNINNTGDQTYSTNPNYWHLRIGDIYYRYDTATYDDSLHQLTADIGPSGKITMGMAYLVDRNLSISDIDMYYNGPGSDGTIGSNVGIKPIDSSTPSIFNYCTLQGEFTTQIGKYNTAPTGKKYAVVTLNINNTGDQTYSTNPNYWHLRIGDIYHQYDTATYDDSLHQLTADIGPSGKITMGMAYLVDRNLSISNMDMYYDGPGSDGIIGSTYSEITNKNINSNPVEPLLPVADFSANPLTGASPLPVQFTDLSQNAVSRNWDFNNDGITDSGDVSPFYTYTAPGIYTVNLTVSNANGTKSKLTTITVQDGSSDSSGRNSDSSDSSGGSSDSSGGSSDSSGRSSHSSGAGGAGGSPEPQSNVEVKELSQTFVNSEKPVKFDFPRNATPVVSVSFDSKKTAGRTTTIAEMLKSKSTLVTGMPADEVYKYLNIWVGNGGFATSKNIEKAVVSFKVEKAWMQDKKIDKASITLNRYSDKKWTQMPAILSGEDNSYLYFTAKTPGYSSFAITGKTTVTGNGIQPATGNKTQSAVNDTQNKSNGSTVANVNQTAEKKDNTSTPAKESKSTPGFEIMCGMTAMLAVYLYRRK